jgi:hypothetical protein
VFLAQDLRHVLRVGHLTTPELCELGGVGCSYRSIGETTYLPVPPTRILVAYPASVTSAGQTMCSTEYSEHSGMFGGNMFLSRVPLNDFDYISMILYSSFSTDEEIFCLSSSL